MKFARQYLDLLWQGINNIPSEKFEEVADVLINAYENNKQVFIFGNGGSAAIASHMACDLGKGTLTNVYDADEKRFKVIALTDNMSLFSALANDVGYEHVFSQQLQNLAMRGDVVIGISGSGNSINVINGLILAKNRGATTIGFVGFDGGKMKKICDYCLHFEDKNYQRSEDAHLIFQHIISSYIAERKKDRDLRSIRKIVKGSITTPKKIIV